MVWRLLEASVYLRSGAYKSILCKNNQAEKHEKKEKKKNVLKAEKYLIKKL